MVAAGVYLVARFFPIFSASEEAINSVAVVGGITALMAATMGIVATDIKRVLAYSTISQLGYMMLALGVGGFAAGMFHLFNHAFFKALLFLGAGSVNHATHTFDMRRMGGLRRFMPWTFITFVIGSLSLAGIFPLSGFWSKDEILAHAWHEFLHEGVVSWPFFVWLLLTIAAFLTAFYTGRQICLTFLGKPRGHHAEHAHETPRSMTVPLILLAIFALTLGFTGIPEEIIGHGRNWFHHFVGHEFAATPLSVPVMLLSSLLAVGGLFLGWLVYGRKPLAAGQPDPLVKVLGRVHTVLKNKYYFDELYHATFVRGAIALANVFFYFDNRWVIDPIVNLVGRIGRLISDISAAFDLRIIDGLVDLAGRVGAALSSFSGILDLNIVDRIVDGVGETAEVAGQSLRRIQTGRAQNYLLVALATVLMLLGLYVVYW